MNGDISVLCPQHLGMQGNLRAPLAQYRKAPQKSSGTGDNGGFVGIFGFPCLYVLAVYI